MQRIGIIGAGAIAEQAYLPALERLPDVTLAAIVDVDESRARLMARSFGAERVATTLSEVLDDLDVAIIATPPSSHAEIAETCLLADIHVLTEKPVATSAAAANDLVELAAERSLHYGISRQLREAPACRLARTVVRNGTLGQLERVRIRYGDATDWPFASDYRLRPDQSWGGVLTDRVPHVLDVLLWTFGNVPTIDRYRDDSIGGLEANAFLEMTFDPDIDVSMEVTSTRIIPNELHMTGPRGEFRANPHGERAHVLDYETGETVALSLDDWDRAGVYQWRVGAQAERFIESIRTDTITYVPARSGAEMDDIYETCYRMRERVLRPFETVHLREAMEAR